jgi:predicted acyl esterase
MKPIIVRRPLDWRAPGAVLSLAATLSILACAPVAESEDAPAAAAPASRFGDYGPEPPPFDGRNRHSVYVAMEDGVRVAVDYYLPTANGVAVEEPAPVVLHYTRYVRAWEGEDGKLTTALDQDPVLEHLSRHGYVVAVADARGTGASFGVNNVAFSPEETADSHTLIEWLAAQPWSSGKVGMQGRSYPGMTQYEAATQAPPALKAIFAEMAGPTAFDFVFTNGTYKKDFVDQWGKLTKEMDLSTGWPKPARVDADADGKERDRAVAGHAANLWAHDVMSTPETRRRDFDGGAKNGARWSWEAIATIDDLDEIQKSGVAIYHLVGWYDIYTTQQPFLYASLEGVPQKMMIGPWVHSGGYGGKVHKAEILRWYDYWLKGVANGIMDEEPVHYFVMAGNHTVPAEVADAGGSGTAEDAAAPEPRRSADEKAAEEGGAWIATREWPPSAERRRFHFGAGKSGSVDSVNDGTLAIAAAAATEGARPAGAAGGDPATAAGEDAYRVDYTSTVGSFSRWRNGYGSEREEPKGSTFFDERTAEDRKALTWTSPPLAEDLTIVGYPTLRLWVSTTHRDGDVIAYLEEIDAEGRAHYVTEGALRLSHRQLSPAPWDNFGLPFHRAQENDVVLMTPGAPTAVDFDLEGTAIVIDAGHRLRVTVAGADRANYELWPDPEGVDAPTLTVHRGGEHASYVELPIAGGGET